jgi:hypothetical protein
MKAELTTLGRLKHIMDELLVPKPSAFEVEMAIEKVIRYKSPGIDQIPEEIIKASVREKSLTDP